MTVSTDLNIYQKLVQLRKGVGYLKKTNQGHQYKYVSSPQVLLAIKEEMNELGLMVIPRVTESDFKDRPTQKGTETITTLKMRYTIVNADKPEETLEIDWVAQGIDSREMGVGKALTYSEKYFYLKLLGIATGLEDDPDSHQEEEKRPRNESLVVPKAQPKLSPVPTPEKEEKTASKAEKIEKKLGALASRFPKGKEWLEASLKGRHITYETMTRPQFEEFEKLIPTLTNKIIEEDIGILKSSTSEKLLEKGVAPEEVAKIGNALAEKPSPQAELYRVLKLLESAPEDKEVGISNLVVLIEYLKHLKRKDEAMGLEKMLDEGLGVSKKDFLEIVQSTKTN